MITLGITGRSGCGKSTVTAHFVSAGLPCADADRIARDVLCPGSPCLPLLLQAFGADLLCNGVLDRHLLADRAFATPTGTQLLTQITHPEILRRIRAMRQAAEKSGFSVFVVDGAVLIGTEFEAECDRILVVTAPFSVSVARICRRDGICAEMAARRLNAQMPESRLLEKADYVICNDSAPEALSAQVNAILADLRKETHA